MGTYIYKAKVETIEIDGEPQKIGIYGFWYKRTLAWGTPTWQRRRESIAKQFMSKHPEGVKYFTVCDKEDWDKKHEFPIYKAYEPVDVVVSDTGVWDEAQNLKNMVGSISGPWSGKKAFKKI